MVTAASQSGWATCFRLSQERTASWMRLITWFIRDMPVVSPRFSSGAQSGRLTAYSY